MPFGHSLQKGHGRNLIPKGLLNVRFLLNPIVNIKIFVWMNKNSSFENLAEYKYNPFQWNLPIVKY